MVEQDIGIKNQILDQCPVAIAIDHKSQNIIKSIWSWNEQPYSCWKTRPDDQKSGQVV